MGAAPVLLVHVHLIGGLEATAVALGLLEGAGDAPGRFGWLAFDPLRDDSLVLAEFLRERGVPHRLEVYEGVLHGFLHCSAVEPRAMRALEDGAAEHTLPEGAVPRPAVNMAEADALQLSFKSACTHPRGGRAAAAPVTRAQRYRAGKSRTR